MENRSLFLSGLVGALVMVVLSNVPFLNLINCLICAGLWLGGMAAVWFYRRQTGQTVTGGQGALLGVVAGVIGAIISSIISATLGGDALQAAIDADPSGQVRSIVGGFVGSGASFLVSFLFNIILYPLFGAIGGAIFAMLTRPKTTV
jgi:hypothetical protein